MIISVPVQIAVCPKRPLGDPVPERLDQVSVAGLYRPPSPSAVPPVPQHPPQTNISVPVHTAVWFARADGAPTVEMGVHLPVAGLRRAPSLKNVPALLLPPQMRTSLPVQTALASVRALGSPPIDSQVFGPRLDALAWLAASV